VTADPKRALRASKTFCVAPWTHLHVLTTGEIFPCCMSAHQSGNAIGHLRRGDSLESAWNSERMRSLRLRMLNDEPSPLCERCYAVEAAGQQSWRTSENELMAHHVSFVEKTDPQGTVPEINLPYLDIRFSNACNLRCRICNPKLSSAWYKDGLAMELVAPSAPAVVTAASDPDVLWDQVLPLLPRVERFHFAGGEPLLMEEHYRILDELVRRDMYDVKLSYNTNLSRLRYRNRDVAELWKRFRNVYLQASLDGMGARGDYMRKGQYWDDVVRNRERIRKECPHVDFCVLATVSVMNVLHLPDFYEDWAEKGYIEPSGMRLNILFEPDFFNIRGLPGSFKERVRERYSVFLESNRRRYGDAGRQARGEFESVMRYMLAEDRDRLQEFRQYTKDLDVLRGESCLDAFPELAELIAPSPHADHLHAGRSLSRFGRTEEALGEYDRGIGALSDQLETARAGDARDASGLEAALALAFLERGELKLEHGDEREAERDYDRASEMDALLAQGRDQKGSLERPERTPLQYANRAQRKRESGDPDGALRDFTRAVQLAPTRALEHLDERIAASRDGVLRLFPSRRDAEEPDMFSTLAFGYFLRGVARRQLGDRDGAVADFTLALRSEPSSALLREAAGAAMRGIE
jgi:MoaA/NifB/PqqE/SkfB family radical SAM enzyme